MIDYVRINVRAGAGGSGSGSSQHIKGKRYGKADGGDGGSGGNVYIEASRDQNTLERYRFIKDFAAGDGTNGASRRRKGASATDLVLAVPVGTIVKVESQSQKSEISQRVSFSVEKRKSKSEVNGRLDTSHFDFDLVNEGDRALVVRGGEGGRGNAHLRDEYGRRPRVGEKGETGEVCAVTLELKLIADVGLIGLPNAGKSTLLAALTAARPKIAAYPFTTLEPNLGVLSFTGPVARAARGPVASFPPAGARSEDQSAQAKGRSLSEGQGATLSDEVELRAVGSPSTGTTPRRTEAATRGDKSLIMADIPGLIEGASAGRGLGDLFLRHVERTRVLVHLIDISQDRDFWQDYQTIRVELKNYSVELTKKKEIVVLTKIDLAGKERLEKARDLFRQHRKKVLAISAKTGEGLGDLVAVLS